MADIKYNDDDLKEFAKIAAQGSYGEYEGCKTLSQKLNRYKTLKRNKNRKRKEEVLYNIWAIVEKQTTKNSEESYEDLDDTYTKIYKTENLNDAMNKLKSLGLS
jgi:putative protein kinase ArgK-like GTPase of G3E family